MTVVPLAQREFELYALSLPRGPNFGPLVVQSAWKAENANSIGVVFQDEQGGFEKLVMRRQVDHRFVVTQSGETHADADHATHEVAEAMRQNAPPEKLQPGRRNARPSSRRPWMALAILLSFLSQPYSITRRSWQSAKRILPCRAPTIISCRTSARAISTPGYGSFTCLRRFVNRASLLRRICLRPIS
jgi:hypothetical protein